jgi:hypothetical protein
MHLLSFLMGYISIYRSGKEHIYIYIYVMYNITKKRKKRDGSLQHQYIILPYIKLYLDQHAWRLVKTKRHIIRKRKDKKLNA